MFFRKKDHTKERWHPEDYPDYLKEKAIIEKEMDMIDTLRPLTGGSHLQSVLYRLPDTMMVNVHFHGTISNPYRRKTVRWCKQNIPRAQKLFIVTKVQMDRLYDGSKDNLRPVAVLEVPGPGCLHW